MFDQVAFSWNSHHTSNTQMLTETNVLCMKPASKATAAHTGGRISRSARLIPTFKLGAKLMLKSYVGRWQPDFNIFSLQRFLARQFRRGSFVYGGGNQGCRSQRAHGPRGLRGAVRQRHAAPRMSEPRPFQLPAVQTPYLRRLLVTGVKCPIYGRTHHLRLIPAGGGEKTEPLTAFCFISQLLIHHQAGTAANEAS